MIKYDRFWVTMKERGITQYDLYELNITVRQSRQSGVARATCPD